MRVFSILFGLALSVAVAASAADSVNAPRPTPLTRPEMKQLLEDMKGRTPRIPLPELTEADKEKLGERATSYESRLRYHYLPGDWQSFGGPRPGGTGGPTGAGGAGTRGIGQGGGGFGRDNDPDNTLDYAFKVQLFWIVSRVNNCQYCLGHQESKLLRAGMTEDQIAALDGDWSQHTPAERAAYAFARKFTYEPHRLSDADIDALRPHFTDKQILEMILSMAGNNSINRWKEGAGVPQSSSFGFGRPGGGGPNTGANTTGERQPEPPAEPHSYVTPTSPKFQTVVTKVAPLTFDPKTGAPTKLTLSHRPPLESRDEVEKALAVARQRHPRLPLADEATTKELLPDGFPGGPLPQWTRLLATFPNSAKGRIAGIQSSEHRGDLKPLLKAQLLWIIARQDRAWYATGLAQQRLKNLGWTDDQIYSLNDDWSRFTPAERSLFTLARQLAASPVMLTDAEVSEAVKQAGPRDVVQAISYTTHCASFGRITEAAGLQIEE